MYAKVRQLPRVDDPPADALCGGGEPGGREDGLADLVGRGRRRGPIEGVRILGAWRRVGLEREPDGAQELDESEPLALGVPSVVRGDEGEGA